MTGCVTNALHTLYPYSYKEFLHNLFSKFGFQKIYIYIYTHTYISSVQWLSHVRFIATLCTAACQASLSITNSWNLLKLMSIESVMPSNHLIFYHPLLLPSIFPSIRVFSNESAFHIRWPKYWSFSFNISPSSEHRTDLLEDGLAGSPCSPMDYQESSPTPQFKTINSSTHTYIYIIYFLISKLRMKTNNQNNGANIFYKYFTLEIFRCHIST